MAGKRACNAASSIACCMNVSSLFAVNQVFSHRACHLQVGLVNLAGWQGCRSGAPRGRRVAYQVIKL